MGRMPKLTPSSIVYARSQRKVVVPQELLAMHGQPLDIWDASSPACEETTKMMELVVGSFNGFALMAMLLSVFYAFPLVTDSDSMASGHLSYTPHCLGPANLFHGQQ